MPRRDGTGPRGSGGGLGRRSKGGQGPDRNGVRAGAGPGGFCECPKCRTSIPHKIAQPCSEMHCPQCGTAMIRA